MWMARTSFGDEWPGKKGRDQGLALKKQMKLKDSLLA
jgi:hypothetical protein